MVPTLRNPCLRAAGNLHHPAPSLPASPLPDCGCSLITAISLIAAFNLRCLHRAYCSCVHPHTPGVALACFLQSHRTMGERGTDKRERKAKRHRQMCGRGTDSCGTKHRSTDIGREQVVLPNYLLTYLLTILGAGGRACAHVTRLAPPIPAPHSLYSRMPQSASASTLSPITPCPRAMKMQLRLISAQRKRCRLPKERKRWCHQTGMLSRSRFPRFQSRDMFGIRPRLRPAAASVTLHRQQPPYGADSRRYTQRRLSAVSSDGAGREGATRTTVLQCLHVLPFYSAYTYYCSPVLTCATVLQCLHLLLLIAYCSVLLLIAH